MNQVRKTSIIVFTLMLALASLTGCGISGPLYEVDNTPTENVSANQ